MEKANPGWPGRVESIRRGRETFPRKRVKKAEITEGVGLEPTNACARRFSSSDTHPNSQVLSGTQGHKKTENIGLWGSGLPGSFPLCPIETGTRKAQARHPATSELPPTIPSPEGGGNVPRRDPTWTRPLGVARPYALVSTTVAPPENPLMARLFAHPVPQLCQTWSIIVRRFWKTRLGRLLLKVRQTEHRPSKPRGPPRVLADLA